MDVADAVELSAAELSAKASTRTTNRVLVLRPGSLLDGRTYRFTLTAYDGSLQGQNQVDVAMNEFEQSGTLAVRPSDTRTHVYRYVEPGSATTGDVVFPE